MMTRIGRRTLLRGSAAAAGGAVLGVPAACTEPADFDPGNWNAVREQFSLDPALSHFAAFVLAAHPRPVAKAIERHRRGLDTDTETYLNEGGDREGAVRAAAAEYLGAAPEEIALTDSTTMGLGLLYRGVRLKPGQEVLTTEHDFFSTHEALRLRAASTGAEVRRVKLYDDPAAATVDEMVGRLLDAVRPNTRVVAVTWVHSSTGVKLPIAEMAAGLADLNRNRSDEDRILFCVDGVHGFGAEDAGVDDLGCDFLVSGTHKWLFGPRGTGFVWGKGDAWPAVDAIIPPFEGASFAAWFEGTDPSGLAPGPGATPGGYHSFEHRWALKEAFEFHQQIGRAVVARRTTELAALLKAELGKLSGVTVVTPADSAVSSGIVCADVSGQSPFELMGRLRERKIVASTTPYRTSYLRFGTSIVTDEQDTEKAVRALRELL